MNYDELKWSPFFKGADAPLHAMENAELITVVHRDGVYQTFLLSPCFLTIRSLAYFGIESSIIFKNLDRPTIHHPPWKAGIFDCFCEPPLRPRLRGDDAVAVMPVPQLD